MSTHSVNTRRHTISAIGDSLTQNDTLGVCHHLFWPEVLASLLRTPTTTTITDGTASQSGPGCYVQARNFGTSGDTTGPYVIATDTVASSSDSTHVTVPTGHGANYSAGYGAIINDQLAFPKTIAGDVLTFSDAITGTLAGATITQVSERSLDMIQRLNLVLGAECPTYHPIWSYDAPRSYHSPDIAVIWGGTNDASKSIGALNLSTTLNGTPTSTGGTGNPPTSGYTALTLQTGQGANARVGQAVVIVNGTLGTASAQVLAGLVLSVTGDVLHVSGTWQSYRSDASPVQMSRWPIPYSLSSNPLQAIPPSGSAVYQGTQANLAFLIHTVLVAQATQFGSGKGKVIVPLQHYLNYSSGGDTYGSGGTTGENAGYLAVRTAQIAAAGMFSAATLGTVVTSDLYGYMRDLIHNATPYTAYDRQFIFAQNDSQWHVANPNTHLNALGNAIVAQAMLATIQAQSGWITALQA